MIPEEAREPAGTVPNGSRLHEKAFLCEVPYMDILAETEQKNRELQKKCSVGVFYPLEPARLSLGDLVVYSYRACQDEFQQAPSARQVARAVGMGRSAVMHADRALTGTGLLDCNLIPQEPPEGWFQRSETVDPARHWRHGYAAWTKYVPQPDCRMSLLTVCCWSYIAYCAQSGRTLKNGLGASYLCRVLCADRTSVQRVLATLGNAGLVQRHEGSWCPTLASLDWLADEGDSAQSNGKVSPVQWVGLPEGKVVAVPANVWPVPAHRMNHQETGTT